MNNGHIKEKKRGSRLQTSHPNLIYGPWRWPPSKAHLHHTDGILHPPPLPSPPLPSLPLPHKAKVSHRFIIVATDDNRCFRRVLDAGLTSIKRAMFEREAIFHCRRQRNTATRWGSDRITPEDQTNGIQKKAKRY